MLLVFLKVR